MKKAFLLFLLAASATLTGCFRDQCEKTYTYIRYEPIYRPLEEIRVSPIAEAPKELKNPGKIYSFGKYLFINEADQGIHIIDNSDPSNPAPVAFWKIEGNTDIAIRGNYLYANQYIDLITVDIQDIQSPKLVDRQEMVFTHYSIHPEYGFLVRYEPTEVKETLKCNDPNYGAGYYLCGDVFYMDAAVSPAIFNAGAIKMGSVPTTGTAGSFACFGQYLDYLYVIDHSKLNTFSVANAAKPSLKNTVNVGWNIETLFPYENRLFIGSQSGMYVYNNSNPEKPYQEAVFEHARACDPVVTDGDYAYVTLHSGTVCQGFSNQVDVIDIKQLPATTLVKTYPMTKPMGLANTSEYVYVCDDGVKVMKKVGNGELAQVAHDPSIETYDAIALDESLLLIIGPDGLAQYDITDPLQLKKLSLLPVSQ